ncbi:hypothetical protein [Nocardia vaccinii]|uniref:hypothetical protein n=1 Tax=Nocardia vaccinii TaxID=1822 RepID=UPI000833651D|nr:hypothetical protein [Nocardia vaccinii]
MSSKLTDIELKQLADRYLAQWNEPDPRTRRQLIRELWAADGVQVLVNPPEQIRDSAANLAIAAPPLEVRGYDAMDQRVSRAYEMFVEPGQCVFELAGEAAMQAGAAVTLTWVWRSRTDGSVAGSGFDVLTVDEAGRIRTDHQFVG